MTDLLGCPFCGSSNSTICANSVKCEDCGGRVILDWSPGDDGENAIAAWNRRSPTPEHGGRAGWRPIETAPRDGRRVDLWVVFERGARRVTDTYYDMEIGEWWLSDHYHAGQYVPRPSITRWQPLPDPPSGLSASLGGGEGSSVAESGGTASPKSDSAEGH